jgi:hypothetical protein
MRDKNRRVLEFTSPDERHLQVMAKARRAGTWQGSTNDGDVARADSPDSAHNVIQYARVRAWRNRWDLLSL